MQWPDFIRLNIRQKVVAGLTIGMLISGVFGFISFRSLQKIERKQYFVEVADDLSNTILEMRRYEKNYLLYGSEEDLKLNLQYIQKGTLVLQAIAPEIEGFQGAPLFEQLSHALESYSKLMESVSQQRARGVHRVLPELEEQLRERGKALVDLSQQLVTFERKRILNIITALKRQLLSAIAIFGILGVFIVIIVGQKIIRPLRVIERTTERIARGNFRPLPVRDTRDETQRVVEAFNRMVAELEKRQEQLLQAKKLSSLGILTSGIAHQLNNPLNNISTSCQILLEEIDQVEIDFLREMLTNIEQEVCRARDIVRGLLEFSREKQFSIAPVALSEVIDRSIRLISSQVPAGIEIIKEIPDDLVIDQDAQRMQQVFLNLFMNSIQAIQDPPGKITVRAESDPAKGEAVIFVGDTGIGIPEQDIGKVFDPFFTSKEVGAGTGLGLSIVYGIIEKHRGSISVESQEGEGTRFIIRLPLHAGSEIHSK